MKAALLASALLITPAWGADALYGLYAAGQYDEAIRAGTAAATAPGYAIAARAALADAALRPQPCMDCLKRAEKFARAAVAADAKFSDGHVWLAASLGLEGRISGLVMARVRNTPGEAKDELDAALKADPHNPYALAAIGGWNVEIVRAGGAYLARKFYGASLTEALSLFDRAVHAAPGNVAVHYQIALSLSGFDPDTYRGRIENEFTEAVHATPDTAYEKAMQGRAGELLALLRRRDSDRFDDMVHKFQGYPE